MFNKMNDWMLKVYVENKEAVRQHLLKFRRDESGAGTVEYAMIIAVVVVMIIAATAVIDSPIKEFFKGVIAKIKTQSGV